MRSLFPCMDPWLEFHWRDVHTSLTVYSRDQIQTKMAKELLARVEEGISIYCGEESTTKPRTVAADVGVVEDVSDSNESEASGSLRK